ncbi:hypothetical protein PHYBLDRAFT_167283 [Phycomyces blakesleeanus NRRL 1555(-)]|uniref:Uncharacterized protein n=1 Tax=Phycomyces blakesleeanus (strain ATCC 8743b / DSM 1359 / FGSC 10004 / NBRC 33097 / NRRL 1555) TaxID=763407 RepID=A0A167N4C5_PHYB8|nr:hypothetical protein PHYBLDRAFT_167283 [Phycomyces blakesleeanus NRRL 1555(-)]OAD74949.1 hypothetical protein PHYBLDRAFT_167283 [Phycomyces blakesleeanus NRRL 1555(-)]|eukprot:XP_018292989.1 hypothetical protein PHYBLDRAFT_167283 [Phycomyces blakesleeanus NRRL 1555(-)]
MPHTPINILAKSTLDASAAITQHTLKKMIKMLSDSNVIACEEDHDTYKDFASICKLKLQQEKLMVTKVQDKISKGRYFFKGQNKTKKLVTQKERLNFLLALDESGFLEEFRMSKSSFYKLYDLVKNHELYQQLSGFYSIDVRLQISIVLDRLGSNGNSSSSGRLARRSGIGNDDKWSQEAKRRWEDREKAEVERLRKTGYSEESGVVDGSQNIDGNTRWIQTQRVVMSKEKNKSS